MDFERQPHRSVPRRVLRTGLGHPQRVATVGTEYVETTQPETADELIVLGVDTNSRNRKSLITFSLPLPGKDERQNLITKTGLGTEGQLVMALSRGIQAGWNMLSEEERASRRKGESEVINTTPDKGLYVKLIELGKKDCPELDGYEA